MLGKPIDLPQFYATHFFISKNVPQFDDFTKCFNKFDNKRNTMYKQEIMTAK